MLTEWGWSWLLVLASKCLEIPGTLTYLDGYFFCLRAVSGCCLGESPFSVSYLEYLTQQALKVHPLLVPLPESFPFCH